MSKTALIVFAFIGVFLSGAVAGGFFSVRLAQRAVQKKAVDQVTLQQLRRIADQLQLTPEQRGKIRPLVARTMEDMQMVRKQTITLGERLDEDINKELTDEQRVKLREIRQRQRDDERGWQRWMREQRARRGGPPMLGPEGPFGDRPGPGPGNGPGGMRPQNPQRPLPRE